MYKPLKYTAILAVVTAMSVPFVSVVDAKSFKSSSSFSRTTYRSPSTPKQQKPSFQNATKKETAKQTTKTQTVSAKPAPKQTVSAKPQPKKTFAATPNVARKQDTQNRARFKKQPEVTKATVSSTTYKSSPVYSRASSYDRNTYYQRRSRYYDDWNTPSYVYYGSPSYGLLDTMFLYYMLSNASSAGQMSYHYQNDPDYRAWRADANQAAVENAELRAQLAAMDAEMAKQSGPIDSSYIPEGVDADLMLSQEARVSLIPEFNACVAGSSGTYANLMTNIVKPNTSNVRINIVPTSGSREILANVASGKCDGGFVQGDSYWNYIESHQTTNLPFERVISPYKESVHLVCNKGAATSDGLSDLGRSNTVYFPGDSGAEETWTNLVNENNDYDNVKAVVVGSYESAIAKASQDPNGCALYVGATGSSQLMRKTDLGAKATNLVLVEVVDKDILKTTDPSGTKVYSVTDIDEDVYPNMLREGGCYGWCSGDVPTLAVNADFIVGTQWKTKHEKSYDGFVLDLMGMQPKLAKGANR